MRFGKTQLFVFCYSKHISLGHSFLHMLILSNFTIFSIELSCWFDSKRLEWCQRLCFQSNISIYPNINLSVFIHILYYMKYILFGYILWVNASKMLVTMRYWYCGIFICSWLVFLLNAFITIHLQCSIACSSNFLPNCQQQKLSEHENFIACF